MDNNVVSFQKLAEHRYEALQEKLLYGIDTKDLNKYYDTVVKDSILHFTFLQKYLAEEFLGETVIDSFTMGVKASKLRLDNKEIEEIQHVYFRDIQQQLKSLLGKHDLTQYLLEEDVKLISKMANELSERWFRKGVIYGEKQRKLRLM